MAKLTNADVERFNAKCANGFTFDVRYYLIHHEKTLRKIVPVDGGHVEIKLLFDDEWVTKTNEYGCHWNVTTGRKIPTVHVSFWRPTGSGCFCSSGLGKWFPIGDPIDKKKFSVLQDLTGKVDVDKYVDIATGKAA